MIEPEKLAAIKAKDPVINTFTWEGLRDTPQNVEEIYCAHAITHMSLGDTSNYVDTLKKNITKNKHCSVGAIVGPYGYGKTSTAIHVWKEMQDKSNILSVPPFEWIKLADIIEAVDAWVKYKFNKGPRQYEKDLADIYEVYHQKALEELAGGLGISIEKATDAYSSGTLNLEVSPARVIAYLLDVSKLCTNKAGFSGLVVFVDELQETADKYPSLRDFQSDLFAFADKIPTYEGQLAVIFTMPDTLEANINTTRPDIIHRLRQSSLYIRVEAIYGRDFPSKLWDKFADVFDFKNEKYEAITEDSLDAIGQIASRKDLGSGPRTVIKALVEAVKHYEGSARPYNPINLVDGFLENKISFEEGGKFSHAVRTALEQKLISSRMEYSKVIKLLAAFPFGCPHEILKIYNVDLAFDQLLDSPIYGVIIYLQSEGYTLRSLLEVEVSAEPSYVRLVRDDFIRSFNPDRAHARQALLAFNKYIIESVFTVGRKDQIDKWQSNNSPRFIGDGITYEIIGSFSPKYPYRNVNLKCLVTNQVNPVQWGILQGTVNYTFELNYGKESENCGEVLFPPEDCSANEVVFRLNLLHKTIETLNIPRLGELYPPERMTPLFMLSLLQYLDDIDDKIPSPEKAGGELSIVKQRLAQYSTQGLLGNTLVIDPRLGINDVGGMLIKAIFLRVCQTLYPTYTTFITNSQWEKQHKLYIIALRDPSITSSIARGKESLQTNKDNVARLFGQTSKQAVTSLIEQDLSSLARLEWGKGASDDAVLWFCLHPLEQNILQILRDSQYTDQRHEGTIRLLPALEIFEKAYRDGYLKDEIAFAIELLREREYITYNSKTNSIEQLIRSLEDLRESLIDGLSSVEKEIEQLSIISEFDPERYTSRLEQVKTGLQKLKDPDDADELNSTLRNVEIGLRRFIAANIEKTITDLRTEKNKIQPFVIANVPEELSSPILGGQAPWSSVLEACRQGLRRRYEELIGGYKSLATKIESKIAECGPGDEPKAEILVNVEKIKVNIQSDLEQLSNQRAAMLGYQANLRDWKKLLQRSHQIHQDALTAKASFYEASFLKTAEDLWSGISKKFNEAPLDTLIDIQTYQNEIQALESSIGDWLRQRRESFILEKQMFEGALRHVGDDRPMLKTNFDSYISPDDNRRNLREEALEHFQEILVRYAQEYQQLYNELNYAEKVQQTSGELSLEEVQTALDKTTELKNKLSTGHLDSKENLKKITNEIDDLLKTLANLAKAIQSLVTLKPLEGKNEKELLKTIQASVKESAKGADLKEVIINIVSGNPDFELEQVMEDLVTLFKKNQIMIRIQPRR
jgi:hypothetical protein